MHHTPKREVKKLSALSLSLLFAAALMFFFGTRIPYGSILQAISLCFFGAFLFLCIRYILPEYSYHLEDLTFSVTRKMRAQTQVLCRLDLSETQAVKTRATLRKEEKKACDLCYNFCQNLFSDDRICLILNFNSKRALIVLDYDRSLYEALCALAAPTIRQDPTGSDGAGKN